MATTTIGVKKKTSLFAQLWESICKGGVLVWLSCLFMGLGLILKGQVIKGIIYLLVEVTFVLFVVLFAGYYLGLLGSLGTVAEIIVGYEEFFGDLIPIYAYKHNSFQILLFNVLIFGVIFFFIYLL